MAHRLNPNSSKQESGSPDLEETLRSRDQIIIRTSLVGIAANLFLALFKAVIGILSHSIAVTLDAVNNLSDALSSVITIIGYLSTIMVAAIVLYAGITSAAESVKKIIHPEIPAYTNISLVIIAAAVIVKILLGSYFKAKGRQASSAALEASGADASFDAVLSLSVLACALLFKMTGISLEAFVGLLISVFIIRSGIGMMMETVDDIIGKRADPEKVRQIKELIMEEPRVRGAYDLFINNYGPGRDYASVHVELPDTLTVEEVDQITRRVQQKVYTGTGVVLTGVGVYSYNTRDEEAARIRNTVMETILQHEWALQVHAFSADTKAKKMRFDVVFSFDIDQNEGYETIMKEIETLYPDYTITITSDMDIA